MEVLNGKHIVLGVTGSIAAYKAAFLVRHLIKKGDEVQVVMTPAAKEVITPLTLSTLTRKPVVSEFFDRRDGSWNSHVDLGQWADAMLIAPCTAATLGKMASGVADNMLVTTYLSAKAPVFVAPAMDLDMFKHPTTTHNLKLLRNYGNHIIEPAAGELASHLIGKGRMEEPEKRQFFSFLKEPFPLELGDGPFQALRLAGPFTPAVASGDDAHAHALSCYLQFHNASLGKPLRQSHPAASQRLVGLLPGDCEFVSEDLAYDDKHPYFGKAPSGRACFRKPFHCRSLLVFAIVEPLFPAEFRTVVDCVEDLIEREIVGVLDCRDTYLIRGRDFHRDALTVGPCAHEYA